MGTEERDQGPALSEALPLLEGARRRGFYPLMLLLERLLEGRARVGSDLGVRQEGIRFHHDPSLGHASADAVKVELRRAPIEDPYAPPPPEVFHVTTAFLGLTGAVSPLPSYLAEEVAQEAAQAEGESFRQDLFDLFHHRLLSFFHRAGAKYDMPGQYLSDQGDDWSRRALAYLGYDRAPQEGGTVATAGGDASPEPPWRRLRFAPLLAGAQVTAAGLEAALSDALSDQLDSGLVAVEQFVGTWVPLPEGDRTRLGQVAASLGRSTIMGSRLFDRTGKIRVVIGPLDRAGYRRFAGPAPIAAIRDLVTALVGPGLEHEVALRLGVDAVPPLSLDSGGAGGGLGRDAWLGRQAKEARVVVGGAAAC